MTHPGVEQKATWLQIRQNRPDFVLLWGWGVMNSTALKEAAAVAYPREKMLGVWWAGAEADVGPAEDAAKGYNAVDAAAHRRRIQAARGSQGVRLRQGAGPVEVGRASRSSCAPASPRGRGAPPTARRPRPRPRAGRRSRRARTAPGAARDHAGAAEAVHEPEADHGLAARHQRAAGDRVRLARRHPVGDEPAERRERAQRLVEDVAARHLEHDVDLGAVVGLAQRGGELVGSRASTAASAPSSSASARFSSVEAVAITRPAPKRLASWTASEPTPPARGVDDDALARLQLRRRCAAGARPTGPG